MTARFFRSHRRQAVVVSACALLTLALGCSAEEQTNPPDAEQAAAVGEASGPPQSPFWVDPDSPAAQQVKQWKADGRTEDAELIRRIADQPTAVWPAGDDPGPAIKAAREGAAKNGRTAVLVAYNIPHRDCGQHSAGGATSEEFYRQWIGAFADNIEDAKAMVILEPDALPHVADGCTPAEDHDQRFRLMAEAVERLKKQPGVKVYLDAGNPAWINDPGKLAQPLWQSGLAKADGFALNVSNFQQDEANKEYGRRLSKLVGDKHFVIDTSRNGNGPLSGAPGEAWCNPPGRALGTRPTTDTGDPLVDAYLWIKRPGESDGACRGGPQAGRWWPEYALDLARNSKT
ncbi:Endoglucanase A precursor [Streptomyces sp. YIM 130001]|uniref:glycoside hydrolase family 6 protein n=1 Tax=Streptomyces sp. YIM 130001 TaxID=2259644 RepID=UPI000E65BB19|nr:glycoside hydrolase family 6 protein [Streptomyces sp. YIM 130001]RII15720.1 Endoglucanase A precursor [Streptomyces sp. YIM 130001]